MIVRAPSRRGFAGLGAADPSWLSSWTSSGHNDGGSILAFVRAQPDSGIDPWALAAQTGKSIPYVGAYNFLSGEPVMNVANPPATGAGEGALFLDKPSLYSNPVGRWFVHPGDDVMDYAIRAWVLPNIPAQPAPPAQSQAVPVMSAALAAQLGFTSPLSTSPAASGASGDTSGSKTASGAVSGLASIPTWAWLVAAGVAAMLLFGGSDGR